MENVIEKTAYDAVGKNDVAIMPKSLNTSIMEQNYLIKNNSRTMTKEFKAIVRGIPTKTNQFGTKHINRGPILFGEVAVCANEPINESSDDRYRAILEADEIALCKLSYLLELKRLCKAKFTEDFCRESYFGNFIHSMIYDSIDEVLDRLEADNDIRLETHESSIMTAEAIINMVADMVANLSKLSKTKIEKIEKALLKNPNPQLIIIGRTRMGGEVYALLEKYLISSKKCN